MEVDALRYFVRAVEMENISRAAEALDLSQPALSRQIRRLEEELGQSLLTRTGRGVKPTAAGRRLAIEAALILADVDAIAEALTSDTTAPNGTVHLALSASFSDALLPKILAILDARFPDLKLKVTEALSPVATDLVRSRAVDFAIVHAGADMSLLAYERLFEEPLCLIGVAEETGDGPVDFSIAETVKLILPSRQAGLRRMLEAEAARKGLTLDVAVEIDGVGAIKNLCAAGLGHSILPEFSVAREVAAGVLKARPIKDSGLTRELFLAHLALRTPGRAMTTVRAAIREVVEREV